MKQRNGGAALSQSNSAASQPPARDEWHTYRRLLTFARPYLWRLIVGTLCGVLFAGSTTSSLAALREALGRVFQGRIDSAWTVLFLGALVFVLVFVRSIGAYFNAYLIQWVGHRVVMDMRVRAFSHLMDLSVAYFDQTKAGEMISRIINDTTVIQEAVSTVITDLARQPVLLVTAAGYLFYLNWKLSLLSIVLLPMCLYPVILFGRKVRTATLEGQRRLADIVTIMQESIGGVRIVKSFNMEQRELERFSTECKRFFSRIMRIVRAKQTLEPIIVQVAAMGVVVALVYAWRAHMPAEDFFTFVVALLVLYDPVKRLSRIHLVIQQSTAAAERVFEILDTEALVKERPTAREPALPVRSIEFRAVGFAYDETPVLRDINLSIRAGERVAIVGGSGAGKTTLVSLLPRFFDVTEGAILINGTDIRDLRIKSLRALFGLVTQETFLFNDTIAGNIAYGLPGATRIQIERAARLAHAHEFITAMPESYDTMTGERGVRLSGGERQRLAIARAILRNPPILILDEATSSLDTESERMVQAALEEVMKGRTVFAIAHRLSTIVNCDRIVVLSDGTIAEQGTHEKLLAQNGIYRRLYEMQFQEPKNNSATTGVTA
ncbi:MAG: ABC transporter ATP-binding protein [Kiritimatiellia bacterium]